MAPETYRVQEIRSGNSNDCLWVSVAFSSELERDDVLHIVCATSVDEQDRRLRQNTIYLERFDQAYSCYEGADRITVSSNRIDVEFNNAGTEHLSFTRSVAFLSNKDLHGWAEALVVFREMSKHECGRVVSVA
jgi:hypothetical protein